MSLREYVEDTRDNWPDYEVQFPVGLALALLDVADAAKAAVNAHDEADDEMDWAEVVVGSIVRDALVALDEEVASW